MLLNDPAGKLLITPTHSVDAVFTELFKMRTEEFPFFYSDMGQYTPTLTANGVVSVIDTAKNIYIPLSAPRIGASPTFKPMIFEEMGVKKIRGHDGSVINAFNDDRDLMYLDLETRFYNAVPDEYKLETTAYSSRYNEVLFKLEDFYGNTEPFTSIEPVDQVVEDLGNIPNPTANLRVFATNTGQFAIYDGFKYLTTDAIVDDTFLNLSDGFYYIYNGFTTARINFFNNGNFFDYSVDEFIRFLG